MLWAGIFLGGESHVAAANLIVSDVTVSGLGGNDDAGIGFKAYNSSITFLRCLAESSFKGFDLGEINGDSLNILYKVINSTARDNSYGINLNAAGKSYAGSVDWYLINNIVHDNKILGSNIYAGPYNLYAVHNLYFNNGYENPRPDSGNINITPDSNDTQTINAYLYNNIFYKPGGGTNLLIKIVGNSFDSDLSLHSDYNAWVQRAAEPFSEWSYYILPNTTFYYGTNGPGHNSGSWYEDENEPGDGTGHAGSDSHSKGTASDDPTLPPFADFSGEDFSLTTSFQGLQLDGEPWFIAEMDRDRNGLCRNGWDIGPIDFLGAKCDTSPDPPTGFQGFEYLNVN